MYPQLIWPLPLKGYKANLRNTGTHVLYNRQNMLRKWWNPNCDQTWWLDRSNNTTNYQFENKMTKYLRKLKAKRMYFIKKRKDCSSIIHLCLFVKMIYWISTNITPPNSKITLISLQTADVSPHSSRTSMAMSEEKRLPFAGYTLIKTKLNWLHKLSKWSIQATNL